ncbi:MAG: hypothetical protein HY820_36360 [Acidobacteria bacterium]|nr:hypothetical protein [Acidobacteriota bacterium]
MSKRSETWLVVIVVVVVMLLVAIPGMRTYMRATATHIHPNPQNMPS